MSKVQELVAEDFEEGEQNATPAELKRRSPDMMNVLHPVKSTAGLGPSSHIQVSSAAGSTSSLPQEFSMMALSNAPVRNVERFAVDARTAGSATTAETPPQATPYHVHTTAPPVMRHESTTVTDSSAIEQRSLHVGNPPLPTPQQFPGPSANSSYHQGVHHQAQPAGLQQRDTHQTAHLVQDYGTAYLAAPQQYSAPSSGPVSCLPVES